MSPQDPPPGTSGRTAVDPPRWRERSATTGVEPALGAIVRRIETAAATDEVRLAQIRRKRVVTSAPRALSLSAPRRSRALALAVALGILLGGVATGLAGRAVRAWYRGAGATVSIARAPAVPVPAVRVPPKRFKVAVAERAELEIAVDARGTTIRAEDGRAELSGPDVPGVVALAKGTAWREGDTVASTTPPLMSPVDPASETSAPTGKATADRHPTAAAAEARAEVVTDVASDIASDIASDVASDIAGDIAGDVATDVANTKRRSGLTTTARSRSAEARAIERPASAEARAIARPASAGAPAVAPAGVVAEASRLGEVLRLLRRDRNAPAALAALDEYARAFPDGALEAEAAQARVEALLSIGDETGALVTLDRLPLGTAAVDRRSALLRGELRARVGRCPEALGDFDRALAFEASDPIAERALYGRATCRARAGDAAGAARDGADYLARFPDGPHRAIIAGWRASRVR